MDRQRQARTTLENEQLFRKAMVEVVGALQGEVLVDLGAGDGAESLVLGQHVGAKRVICVDHEREYLLPAQAKGAEIVVADLNKPINLEAEVADVVVANQVIEHVAKTDVFVKEIARLLKHGGKAVVCTPNLASWHNVMALSFGWQPFSSQVSDEVFLGNPFHPNYGQPIDEVQAHLRVFTLRSLVELCRWHGLRPVSAKGVGYYPLSGRLAAALARLDPWHAAYLLVVAEKR